MLADEVLGVGVAFGGGMRKSGPLAAAGLVALRESPPRIPDDHHRAKRLGNLLACVRPLRLAYPVYTNIVDAFFDAATLDGQAVVAALARRSIAVTGPWQSPHGRWLRFVTHYGITDDDIDEAAHAVEQALKQSRR